MRIRCSKGATARQLYFSQARHWMCMSPLQILGATAAAF